MDEPEPYENQPVAARFRVSGAGSEASPPQSFELRSHPTPDAVSPAAGIGAFEPFPPGGPNFAGSATTIVAPVGPPGRRKPPSAASGAPMPGTFKRDWSVSAPKRSRRTRRRVAQVLVLAVFAAGVYIAYPRVRTWLADRSVPADLRAYVHGTGVSSAPTGQGYVVRLPSPPATRDILVAASWTQPALVVNQSIVFSADFEIVIRVVDVSGANALRNGLTGAMHDAQLAGPAPSHLHRVVVAGASGFDYDLSASPATHARMILGARHLYVITVRSKSAGAVLDALTQSLRLSP